MASLRNGFGLALVLLLVQAATTARAADDPASPGHICEIDPKRAAIESASTARPAIEKGAFDPSWRIDHKAGEKVYVGSALVTDDTGRFSIWRTGDRNAIVTGVSVQGMRVVVPTNSAVEIKDLPQPGGTAAFVRLERGSVDIECLGCGAGTQNMIASNPKSHFIVRFSRDQVPITEIVTVSGSVTVRNPAARRSVDVATGQHSFLIGNDPPTDPEAIDAAVLRGYLKAFELVGDGRDQSQLVDNQALRDLRLPVGDPSVRPPAAEPGVGPPAIDRPIDRANEPGGLYQPGTPATFEGARLGVEF